MSPRLDSPSVRRNFNQLQLGYEKQRSDSTQLDVGVTTPCFAIAFSLAVLKISRAPGGLSAQQAESKWKENNQTNGFFGRAAPVHHTVDKLRDH